MGNIPTCIYIMGTGNTEATLVAIEFQICNGASSLPTLVTVNFHSQ